MNGHALMKGEIIMKKLNYIDKIKKKSSTGPISKILGTKASLGEGDSS